MQTTLHSESTLPVPQAHSHSLPIRRPRIPDAAERAASAAQTPCSGKGAFRGHPAGCGYFWPPRAATLSAWVLLFVPGVGEAPETLAAQGPCLPTGPFAVVLNGAIVPLVLLCHHDLPL